MDDIHTVATTGNRNAVTDACVAMMCARTAVLGALLNVRINLSSIQDKVFVEQLTKEANWLEKEAIEKENPVIGMDEDNALENKCESRVKLTLRRRSSTSNVILNSYGVPTEEVMSLYPVLHCVCTGLSIYKSFGLTCTFNL